MGQAAYNRAMPDLILEVIEGRDAGRQVRLAGPIEIGRGEDSGFELFDPLVSRRHARIVPVGAGAEIEDLDSLNGTEVNGAELPPHAPTHVQPGDELRIGATVFEVRNAAQVEQRPSAVRPIPPPLRVPARPPDYVPVAAHGVSAGEPPRRDEPNIDEYLDAETKAKARTAPLALFVLAVLVVLLYLALAK